MGRRKARWRDCAKNCAYLHRLSANTYCLPQQSLSQKSKIFASSLYTREPWALPRHCVKFWCVKKTPCHFEERSDVVTEGNACGAIPRLNVQTGNIRGLPHQSADWFAMTRSFSTVSPSFPQEKPDGHIIRESFDKLYKL